MKCGRSVPVATLLSLAAGLAHATSPVARFENDYGDGEFCRTALSAVGDSFVVSTATAAHPQVARQYRKVGGAWSEVDPLTLDTGAVFPACSSRLSPTAPIEPFHDRHNGAR